MNGEKTTSTLDIIFSQQQYRRRRQNLIKTYNENILSLLLNIQLQVQKTMPPQNRNENGGVEHGGLEVERPIHRIVSRGDMSIGSEGNDSTSNLTSPRNATEYKVRKSSLIGYVPLLGTCCEMKDVV